MIKLLHTRPKVSLLGHATPQQISVFSYKSYSLELRFHQRLGEQRTHRHTLYMEQVKKIMSYQKT